MELVAGSSTPAPGPNALPFGTPVATGAAQVLCFGASPLVRATALPAPAAARKKSARCCVSRPTRRPNSRESGSTKVDQTSCTRGTRVSTWRAWRATGTTGRRRPSPAPSLRVVWVPWTRWRTSPRLSSTWRPVCLLQLGLLGLPRLLQLGLLGLRRSELRPQGAAPVAEGAGVTEQRIRQTVPDLPRGNLTVVVLKSRLQMHVGAMFVLDDKTRHKTPNEHIFNKGAIKRAELLDAWRRFMDKPSPSCSSCSKHTGRHVDDSRGDVRQRVHGTHTTRNDRAVECLRRPVNPVAPHALGLPTRLGVPRYSQRLS